MKFAPAAWSMNCIWGCSMPSNLLEVKDLNVYYDQSHILQGVDLVVGTEPVAIVGRNGMGKTTLCKALMGLVPIAKGNISFEGTQLVGQIGRASCGKECS